MMKRTETGFTLIELMIVIGIVAILAALAAPSFQSMTERRQLEGAIETLHADLNFAKSEAIKSSKDVTVGITNGANWSYDITNTDGDSLKTVSGSTYSGIEMATGADITFSSRQGMPTALPASPTFIFRVGSGGDTKSITVNAVGRIKLN